MRDKVRDISQLSIVEVANCRNSVVYASCIHESKVRDMRDMRDIEVETLGNPAPDKKPEPPLFSAAPFCKKK